MTVSSTATTKTATGNGSTDFVDFTFKVFAAADLEVFLDGVLQTITTDYTVTLTDEGESGGRVTFTTPPANAVAILIKRVLDLTQGSELDTEAPLPSDTIEDALDKNTMLVQQVDEAADRAVQLDPTFTTAFTTTLPTTLTARRAILINSGGNGFELSTNDPDTVVTEAEAAQAAAEAAQAAAETAQAGAETAETNAETAETNAETAEANANDWATKTDGFVSGSDNSAKSWAIGGAGDGDPTAGSAKDWAITPEDTLVTGSDYSALHWAAKAANSAAATELPDPSAALNYIRRNAGDTSYENRTVAQVRSDLSLDVFATANVSNYIANLWVEWDSASEISVKSGLECVDSTGAYYITLSSDQTVDISASGANGLDTGSEASNTWYNLYVVSKSSDTTDTKFVFSTSTTYAGITDPAGYDIGRRLPFVVRNNPSSNLLRFKLLSSVNNQTEFYWIDSETGSSIYEIVSGGTSTSFSSITNSASIPPEAVEVTCVARTTNNNATAVTIKDSDSTISTGYRIAATDGGVFGLPCWFKVTLDSSQTFRYKVTSTGAVTIQLMSVVVRI